MPNTYQDFEYNKGIEITCMIKLCNKPIRFSQTNTTYKYDRKSINFIWLLCAKHYFLILDIKSTWLEYNNTSKNILNTKINNILNNNSTSK